MRLKKSTKNKNCNIVLRCSESDKNAIQRKANIYCDGNLSEFILYAALNFVPDKSDLEDEKPAPKRGKK